MGKAAAHNSAERIANLAVGSSRIRVEHGFRRQYHAAKAVSTLGRAFFDECLLQRVRVFRRPNALESRNLSLPYGAHRHDTGPHYLAAHYYGARTALRHAATKLWTVKTQFIVEHE
jgi:hypothetical protein